MAFCCKINRSRRFSLICMLVMTTSFFFAEIAVGYATNSMALVADSFHMLSDVISLVVGLVAVIYSDKTSKTNTYGWARAEVLGALCNAVFLLALCFSIVVEAIQRLVQVEPITQPLLVLGVGGAGLVINLIGLLLFHEHAHGHNHDHGHNHNHSQSHDHSKNHDHEHHDDNDHEHPDGGSDSDTLSEKHSSEIKGGHLNMKGVFLHVLGDALGSVVVIASALAVHFIQADWKFYVDPVMSLLIAIIIVCSTLPLLRQSAFILLQKPPPHIKAEEIKGKLTKIKGVVSVHDLHIWQLSGNRAVASAHVTMHAGDDFAATALRLRHVFHDVGVHSLTLQPEYYPCAKGRSVCGVSDCSFLKEETENLLPNVLNEGEIVESDEGRVMDSLPQNEYSCDTPTSDYPERSPVNQPCKFSCVSNDCAAYMCCDGLRKKKELLSSVVIGEDNPAYGMGPIMVESVSVRV